jgi:hypothetical protein
MNSNFEPECIDAADRVNRQIITIIHQISVLSCNKLSPKSLMNGTANQRCQSDGQPHLTHTDETRNTRLYVLLDRGHSLFLVLLLPSCLLFGLFLALVSVSFFYIPVP